MGLFSGYVESGRRWPYLLFLSIAAVLFQALVLLFPGMPFLVALLLLVLFGGEWGDAMRARLQAVGLQRSTGVMLLYVTFVYIACALLFFLSSRGRFLAPGLFLLLNLPLAIPGAKPDTQDRVLRS